MARRHVPLLSVLALGMFDLALSGRCVCVCFFQYPCTGHVKEHEFLPPASSEGKYTHETLRGQVKIHTKNVSAEEAALCQQGSGIVAPRILVS